MGRNPNAGLAPGDPRWRNVPAAPAAAVKESTYNELERIVSLVHHR
jgi:hypothetical protein